MVVIRDQTLSMMIETNSGVAETASTLFAAANSSFKPTTDLAIEYNVPVVERNIIVKGLSSEAPLTGIKTGTVRFGLEVTGHTSSGVPQIGVPLQACGFRQSQIGRATIGTITGGPFLIGEKITYNSTESRTVMRTTYDGETALYISAATDDFGEGAAPSSGTITGAVSGATATVSAHSAAVGYGWIPASYPLVRLGFSTVTNAPSAGHLLLDTVTGATGTVTAYEAGTAPAGTVYIRVASGVFGTNSVSNISSSNTVGTPASVAQIAIPTLSMGISKSSVREYIYGARGNVSFRGTLGEAMIASFEFQGPIAAPSDGGEVTGITYTQRVPPVMLDSQFKVGDDTSPTDDVSVCIGALTLDRANQLVQRTCMNASTGLTSIEINGRPSTISFDPEVLPETSFDFINNLTTNTLIRARWRVGTSNGNMFLFDVPQIGQISMGQADRNSILTRTINGRLANLAPGSDDDLSILYITG